MFNMDNLLSMAGIPKETVNQLMTVKTMLDKLPKDKQVELITNFTDALKSAVKEVEGAKEN